MILTNFVPTDYQDKLEELILGNNIDWYYQPATVYAGQGQDLYPNDWCVTPQTKESWQFVHTSAGANGRIYSPTHKLFLPILGMAGIARPNINRVKCNLMFRDASFPEGFHNTPHVDDHSSNMRTLLYYVNDSDGDTIIFNERYQEGVHINDLTVKYKCTPKKGTALLFDSNLFHCGSPPRETERRSVINFIFGV